MKIPAVILCIIAAVIALVFAVQFISFYISPPDLSMPDGLSQSDQLYWRANIAALTPATFLAFGLIGLASAVAGMLGGVLAFFENRLTLARGLIIAAAGLSFFTAMTPVSFLYLAAALSTLRRPEKAAEELAALTLLFIGATFIVQWVTGLFLEGTFLSRHIFEGALLLVSITPSGFVYVLGTLSGVVISGAASVVLYRRRQAMPAAALALTAISFILMFTDAANAASWAPFVLFVFGLAALMIKLRKPKAARPKEM